MQRVQNRAARLVLKKRKRDYLALLLNELRWLPVKFRCEYNIATLLPTVTPTAHSLLNHIASLCVYQTSRSLRSSSEKILKMPKCSLKSVGWSSFSFIAPSAWNSLPASLRNLPSLSDFKAQLKTFLFFFLFFFFSTGLSKNLGGACFSFMDYVFALCILA